MVTFFKKIILEPKALEQALNQLLPHPAASLNT